jgi:hypothetical protein
MVRLHTRVAQAFCGSARNYPLLTGWSITDGSSVNTGIYKRTTAHPPRLCDLTGGHLTRF